MLNSPLSASAVSFESFANSTFDFLSVLAFLSLNAKVVKFPVKDPIKTKIPAHKMTPIIIRWGYSYF